MGEMLVSLQSHLPINLYKITSDRKTEIYKSKCEASGVGRAVGDIYSAKKKFKVEIPVIS